MVENKASESSQSELRDFAVYLRRYIYPALALVCTFASKIATGYVAR